MTKARDLANFVSTGNPLADGILAVADISDLTASAAELNILDGVTATTSEINELGDFAGTFTLPATDGTNTQVLQTNGSGVLSFGSLPVGQELVRVTRTSNTALSTAQRGNLVDITSGTFTQTFDAAATLGSGWFCYIRNSGTGDITLDPNSSETIDGLTSFVMYPGETRLIQCEGSNFFSVVLSAFTKTFTSTDTFYKPPGYAAFSGLLWGAGGGGGKRNNASYFAGGGGGGGCHPFTLSASLFGTTETVTVAAGGDGATTDGAQGASGGNTSFGSNIVAYGGGGGGSGTGTTNSGTGGGGGGALGAGSVGGNSNTGSNGGNPASLYSADVYEGGVGYGGASANASNSNRPYWGGGAGNSTASSVPAFSDAYWGGAGGSGSRFDIAGGVSVFGGNGGKGEIGSVNGGDGVAPGGGGGATRTGTRAGNGARGEARIWGVV